MNDDGNYATLKAVLEAAYDQAATGKGAQRHGRGQPFEAQPMQTISTLLDSSSGMAYQAIKKIQEGERLPHERRRAELLGAINYIAGLIIFHDRRHCDEEDGDDPRTTGEIIRDALRDTTEVRIENPPAGFAESMREAAEGMRSMDEPEKSLREYGAALQAMELAASARTFVDGNVRINPAHLRTALKIIVSQQFPTVYPLSDKARMELDEALLVADGKLHESRTNPPFLPVGVERKIVIPIGAFERIVKAARTVVDSGVFPNPNGFPRGGAESDASIDANKKGHGILPGENPMRQPNDLSGV